MNAPKGAFIVRSQWRAVELRCCVFVLQDPLLSSAPSEWVSSVRCPCPCGAGASGWPARRCFLEGEGEKGKWCFTGFISLPNAPFGVLYNCLVMRFRCVRPARANGVQVLPLCFQGDADEVSGHASHYIYISVRDFIHFYFILFQFMKMCLYGFSTLLMAYFNKNPISKIAIHGFIYAYYD